MTSPDLTYRSRAARALVALHDEHMRRFLIVWKQAQARSVVLPKTDDPAYASLETLLRHVLGAARNYMVWICEMLELPDPAIRVPPDAAALSADADSYLEHVLERWRAPLQDVGDARLDRPEYPSRWQTLYSIDAMLEHAVMHPIRHTFQLEELMREPRRRSRWLPALALIVAPAVFAQTLYTPGLVVPSFTDLTIKNRRAAGTASSSRTTELLYLKGARERRELTFERRSGDAPAGSATISQCDQRRSVQLNLVAKLYAVSVFEDFSERRTRRPPVPEGQGADVTTTIDAVDTGERRQVGRYVARRVRTTITVDPSSGANTPASTRETDGWYIDLPGLGCSKQAATGYLTVGEVVRPGGLPDRQHYVTKGAARRGYAIEETTRGSRGSHVRSFIEVIRYGRTVHDERHRCPGGAGGNRSSLPTPDRCLCERDQQGRFGLATLR